MIDERDAMELERRKAGTVRILKEELRPWIDQHSWPSLAIKEREYPSPPYYSAVSCALPEVAIERYMAVHGPDQAIELINGICFQMASMAKKLQ